MISSKKLVIVGPAGTGKTTIKKIFFDMVNPSTLLKTPLEPSRGIISEVYTLFDLSLGVFDLAGQENENWFNKDKDVFGQSNIIMCILDINDYLKDLLSFLEKISKIYREINLNDFQLYILLHKIDLIDALYLQHKIKAIKEYIETKGEFSTIVKIYTTSIAKDFFLKTYDIITGILIDLFENKTVFSDDPHFQDVKTDLEIIMTYEIPKEYQLIDLFHDFKLPTNKALFHLKRLEHLGFIEFLENSQDFKLTDRVNFLKNGLDQLDDRISKKNKILDSLYIFSNLNSQKRLVSENP